MFLTRMGVNCKVIVTGDMTQIDLPYSQKSGLIDALEVLRHVKEIAIVEFNIKDIVRHPLVRLIVDAYEKRSEGFKQSKSAEAKQKTE
jgi:phosphate starvation-inducible PhoH-like protein